MILVIAFTAAAFSACNDSQPTDEGSTIEATEGLLISNSDFKVIGKSGDYPRTITDWSGAKIYSSSTVPGDVIAGAVSLEETLYAANRALWNDDGSAEDGLTLYDRLKSHYSSDEDAVNNVLMIHMPTSDMAESDNDDYGPTAYGYTSKSFSLDAGSYYKLTVDVLTYDIAGTDDEDNVPGARIYLSSAGYAEISGIDTQGEWKTYTVYIESAATSSTSLTLNLGLGKYSSYYRDGLTTGYAFFDNVALEKINDGDVTAAQAKEEYDTAVAEELTAYDEIRTAYLDETATADDETDVTPLAARYSAMTTRTMTLRTSNGRFDFGSTTIGTSAPSGWSLVTGDDAPTSYRFNGVISSSLFTDNVSSYAGTYYINDGDGNRITWTPASLLNEIYDDMTAHMNDSVGDSLYMLSQQMMTAQGIRSSRQIVIEKNGLYALQVSVLTYNVYGGGVSLILSGDGEDIVIEGIAENPVDGTVLFGAGETEQSSPGWRTYTFYIRGNQYKDMSYNLTLWLGTGSVEENTEATYDYYSSSSATGTQRTTYLANGTFASGWAFFDDVTLRQYSADEEGDFDAAINGKAAGYTLDVEGGDATALYTDLSSESYFENASEQYGGISGDFAASSTNDYSDGTLGASAGWTVKTPESDGAVYDSDMVTAGTVDLTSESFYTDLGLSVPGLPYDGVPSTGMMIRATEPTAFTLKSGGIELRANSTYTVSVWVKTDGVGDGKGAYLYLKGLDEKDEETTLASFSAVNTSEVETYNGWSEYTFYIKGSDEGKETVWLEFALGSGTRWSASTLADGAVYFSNMSMLDITYSDYTGATSGTYAQKADLSSGSVSGSFANGSFGNIDYDEFMDAITASDSTDGTLQESDVTGVPEDWPLSDQTITTNEDGSHNANFVGGVIKAAESESTPGTWTASTQIKNLFGSEASFFDSVYGANDPYEAKGAPYMLALAGLNGASYSAGYLSDSFTLDASTNYSISVWAKAKEGTRGMIFLQGEASGSLVNGSAEETLYFEVEADGLWHKYTFNIEVGLTDVSLQLGLWLGENTDVTGGDEEAAKSSGIVLYDSVTLHDGLTGEELDDYTAASYESVKRITFYTDSFDTLEGSTETVDEEGNNILSTPNGWTGAVGTDQERENTTSGVFDTSNPTSTVMGPVPGNGEEDTRVSYVTGLGPDLSLDDFTASDEEIRAWIEENGGSVDNDADVERARTAIVESKYYAAIAARMLPESVSDAVHAGADGNNVLVINNTLDSAYRYGSTSYTLSAETAYKITVRVFTYGIGHVDDNNVWTAADDRGAYIELYLGSADSDENPLHFDNVNTADGWTTYTLYLLAPADDVTNVSLRLGLGRYDADDDTQLVSGFAFFDAVTIEEIGGEIEYSSAVDSIPEADADLYATYRIPEEAEQGSTGDDDGGDTEVPSATFNLDSLWWMIPTIVIGLAIIAVVIVFFVRKYKKKFTKKTPDEPTDSVSSSNVRRKKDDYDSFGE